MCGAFDNNHIISGQKVSHMKQKKKKRLRLRLRRKNIGII